MKLIPVLILLFLLQRVWADSSDEPQAHFFTVPSQSNSCFAVHSVRPWRGSDNIQQYGRLQLFRADTGAELWRIDGVLCYQDVVFPADDGKHLAIVRSSISLPLTETGPVVQFYAEGRLLASYSLKDLGFDPAKLVKSVSHASFAETGHTARTWAWEWPLGTKDAELATMALEPNPVWRGTERELAVLDGQRYRFDGTTGKLLSTTRAP